MTVTQPTSPNAHGAAAPTPPHVIPKVVTLTPHTLRVIMPRAPVEFVGPINRACAKYAINTAKRLAAFLAQVAVESFQLRRTHELWTSTPNFQLPGVAKSAYTAKTIEDYFNYWYGDRPDLGNTSPGDGFKYRGRGAIQVTGRANYQQIGDAIGKPLLTSPDLLETDRDVDMLASAYFFAVAKRLNRIADEVKPERAHSVYLVNRMLTRRVNGGYNGVDERLSFYRRALHALKA